MIVCKRESCIERSKFIIATMDSSRDPCQDFYSYACGRWLKNVNFNSNIDRLIPFELMRLKTENNIRFILSNSWDHERNKLNDKIIKSKSISVEWLARMHQQCHNGTEKNFSVRFKKIWNQFIPSRFNLTWPLGYDQSKNLLRFYKNWLDLYADYYKFFGEGTVFEISSFRLEHNRDSILVFSFFSFLVLNYFFFFFLTVQNNQIWKETEIGWGNLSYLLEIIGRYGCD